MNAALTNCWNCGLPYALNAPGCPACNATNANVSVEKARQEAIGPKHTPGPWTLETVNTSCGVVHRIGPFPWKEGKQNHACIYVDYPSASGAIEQELLANARVMVAAPDLLKQLQRLLRAYRAAVKLHDSSHEDAYTVDVHNAIAKALGGLA